jgi:cytochrome c-type biogenesis protein CcmH
MTASASQPGIDISSIKNQLNQLKGLYDSGALKADAYQEAEDVLERKLVDWALLQAPAEPSAVAPAPDLTAVASNAKEASSVNPAAATEEQEDDKPTRGSWPKVAGVLALAVLAGGGYYWFGSSQGTPVMPLPATSLSSPLMPKQAAVAATPDQAPHSTQVGDIATMADRLAARLAKQPNDPQGWAMLGRSYSVLGSPAEAVKAYEKAIAMLPEDKALKADYANALAEVKKNNLAAGSPVSQAPTATQNQAQPAIQAPAAANASVSGTVSLAPALLKTVQPTDTVFIVARPESGSRMPLAALRKQVKDLPLQFTLDDSMGMSPAIKLSTAGKVIVSARVSKSGNAIPEKGDLSGETAPVAVGSKGLSVVINTAVK